jgi:hypothetical protein
MKFLVDTMLGSLARWLRFLGYDTSYPEVLEDRDLVARAKAEGRIILTRDKTVAKARDVRVIYINSEHTDAQLKQVIECLALKIDDDKLLTRCAECNTILVAVDKLSVRNKVPPGVYARNDDYWYCKVCDKYYWQGTHCQKIMETIDKFRAYT